VAMDGQGPTSGHPFPAGKILMSVDPLALDAVGAHMLGLDILKLPAYAASVRERIGEADLARITVCGDCDAPPRLEGFKLPRVVDAEKVPGNLFRHMIDLRRTRPEVDPKVCRRCNSCVDSCPMHAIDKETKRINYDACIACMCCHELCAYHAVKLVRVNRLMRIFSRPM
jgi:heterodisulfide reductase subunit A-like polyferredoxin